MLFQLYKNNLRFLQRIQIDNLSQSNKNKRMEIYILQEEDKKKREKRKNTYLREPIKSNRLDNSALCLRYGSILFRFHLIRKEGNIEKWKEKDRKKQFLIFFLEKELSLWVWLMSPLQILQKCLEVQIRYVFSLSALRKRKKLKKDTNRKRTTLFFWIKLKKKRKRRQKEKKEQKGKTKKKKKKIKNTKK